MISWYEKQNTIHTGNAPDIPEEIVHWLAEMRLLHGIPLAYLVPNKRMLPPESIAFFKLDENWTDAAANGALSVGRVTTEDARRDMAVLPSLCGNSIRALNRRRMLRSHARRRHLFKVYAEGDDPVERSGFLLRSEIVRYWRGIEVTGHRGEQILEILRMDRLNDEIMLCIFNGFCDSVTFNEPIEEMRFGTNSSHKTIDVRSVTEGEIGKVLGNYTLPCDENGRLNIKKAVEDLSGWLGDVDSARFALQMLTVSDICKITCEEGEK